MWPPSGATSSISTLLPPLTAATAVLLAVSSVQPDGMTVLNAEALKARDAEPAPEAGDVLELGVTVAAGPPHALSTSAVPNAPVARARARDGCKVTPSRIAEGSRLSGHRSGHNPCDGHTFRAPGDTAWAGGYGSACGADRPRTGH